ncbi:MAG TPA: amidohydrolase family protein [Thermoplasmata archaeon]|nr:amidohydrolase family protein [Thermoplasmata archaeon]
MAEPAAHAPLVIRDALIVTQDDRRRVVRGDVRVDAGRFTTVGGRADGEGAEEIDGHDLAVVPGFINAHTHVAMAPLRGIADDRELAGFLETLFAVDGKRTEEDLEGGAAAGVAEMLLGGTTTFLDLYYGQDAVARASERLGVRAYLGWAVLDPEFTTQTGVPLQNARGFIERWKGHARIVPLVAPQGVYVCGEATWLGARALADEQQTLCHYHLAETRKEVYEHEAKTGERPAAWLDKIGFLGPRQVAAHGVWLTGHEIGRLAAQGVAVAHCPSSNLKLAVGGVAPIVELREAGATVGLGTDSVASNNGLSMLREMHLAGLLQKHHRWDATALTASELLDLATREGAKLLGRGGDLGSIEPGKVADFLLVNLAHPSVQPARPEAIISHLAYSAQDEAVESVFVDGECVVHHRTLVRGSWPMIRKAAEAAAESLWSSRKR